MNKEHAIGVFDSGLGGLTAVKELFSCLPGEELIYFGDTGRVPYGTRSEETILKYTKQDISFLRSFPIKAILVACGTVSSIALPILEDRYDIPVIGVVKSAAQAAVQATHNCRVGVIGTPATIRSGAYEREMLKMDGALEIQSVPCPLFVPLVENGRTGMGDPVIETVARDYLEQFKDFKPDTLIMGCTHYPVLKDVIAEIMGDQVALVDPGREGALALKDYLEQQELLAEKTEPKHQFFVSDGVGNFQELAELFLQRKIDEPKVIEIEAYENGGTR